MAESGQGKFSPLRRTLQMPRLPLHPNGQQQVKLSPKLRSTGNQTGPSVPQMLPSRGGSGSSIGNSNSKHQRHFTGHDEANGIIEFNKIESSHKRIGTGGNGLNHNNSGRSILSQPNTSLGENNSDIGTASNSSFPVDLNFYNSISQKGVSKRKRKEYANDPLYASVKRVIDELNRAIGPERRHAAIVLACKEFNHANELQHNAELYLGAANVLCLVLSMSDQEDEIESICSALEMVLRADREAVVNSYQDVGATLVPLLLRLLERYEMNRRVISTGDTISHISRTLLHLTRIPELRVVLAGHPGMLPAMERVATVPLSSKNRELRMRLLANLANSEKNKITIFDRRSLMDATLKVATLDKDETVREYAAAVLMDLSSCPANQVPMTRMDKVLATLVQLSTTEEKVETREYAVSGLQNLAFEKSNRIQLVQYGGGVVMEALQKCISIDSNEKTRRRSAGALTNLVCDETALIMSNHSKLFQTLALAHSDENEDVQHRASLALTKLANSITIKMPCWETLLDALIAASRCIVAEGNVSAMFRVKARVEENRTSMVNHPGLLETLAELCLRPRNSNDDKSRHKDCENAYKAIAHLANEPLNHKKICHQHILAALVHGASLEGQAGMGSRDAAILAIERIATEHSNRPTMARYPGMLVSIANATEREMRECSIEKGQPRLAKPLLMSLLVSL